MKRHRINPLDQCLRDPDRRGRKARPGVILLITLVILVILATLGSTLVTRVAARRHRDQYVVDYSQAQYACASAMKYAMASISELQPQPISRPNEPDFSDIFAMSEVDYQKYLAEFALSKKAADDASLSDDEQMDDDEDARDAGKKKKRSGDAEKRRNAKAKAKRNAAQAKERQRVGEMAYGDDVNDINDVNDLEAEPPAVPGPYGPPWPLVSEALECEIGSAKVKIEIEDENAKYPLNWALIADEQWKPLAEAGFVTFCEWMGYPATEITDMREGLGKIGEFRAYQLEFKPLTKGPTEPPPSLRSRVTRQPGQPVAPGTASPARRTLAKTVASPAEQMEQQTADFAKLFHSSMVNTDLLSRPSIASDTRKESALKYLGLWTTKQVNVNTAPRNVLEAALTFGSAANAPKIATEIIRLRQTKPFTDIEEVKKGIFQYSDSIDKCKDFLTTTSNVFTVRVTAISGVAKATMIAAVSKEGDKVKQIGIVSD